MLEEAHYDLHALEADHWWFVGARAVYRTLLELGLGKACGKLRMLEIGSGSGGNLRLLGEYGPTVGIEFSRLALSLTPDRPVLGLVQASAEALPFMNRCFDGVNILGVIEHLKNDEIALSEARRVCHPDGALVLLTSALPVLWSHHDIANQHQRRYLKNELSALLTKANLVPIRLSYQNFFTFFPVFIVRLWQRGRTTPPRYDMGKPIKIVNQILVALLRFEAWLIRFMALPIGVDLVAVCRVGRIENE